MDDTRSISIKLEDSSNVQNGKESAKLRYSVSLVKQGKHTFYTLTIPSDVLARTCFVSTRDVDPKQGFQRVLDKKRAIEIADYIDNGLGTIPNSIVLSAQPEAEFKSVSRQKTIEFNDTPKSFLILDGQHRVYGFSMAKTALRVPVVIYNGLSRQDETRLFIDINTKQRPVPSELLLDIKQLAEYESNIEARLRVLFDIFNTNLDSPLLGMMSPSSRQSKKISRVTFNTGVKPLINLLKDSDNEKIYDALNSYLKAFIDGMSLFDLNEKITNPIIFRAAVSLFPEVAQRVKDRFNSQYTQEFFYEVLEPMFNRLKASDFINAGNSVTKLKDNFSKTLKTDFSL
jgi:DGQHR domain-containing protein